MTAVKFKPSPEMRTFDHKQHSAPIPAPLSAAQGSAISPRTVLPPQNATRDYPRRSAALAPTTNGVDSSQQRSPLIQTRPAGQNHDRSAVQQQLQQHQQQLQQNAEPVHTSLAHRRGGPMSRSPAPVTTSRERRRSSSSSSTAGEDLQLRKGRRAASPASVSTDPASAEARRARNKEARERAEQDESRARATLNHGRPVAQLIRSRSDFGPQTEAKQAAAQQAKAVNGPVVHMRHGWEDQYSSEAYLSALTSAFYMYYTEKRHDAGGLSKAELGEEPPLHEWRMRDRLKTVSAALALCLNIGVDPPDVIKTNPCAKLECWVDSSLTPSTKTLEQIGKNLQQQYESLSIRTRYKQYLDPSIEETKKFCNSLRRNAKDERVLLHYNGHGVPKPTASGEIWVFNKNYTQYIPISLFDLQQWLGAPSLFIFDCSEGGNIASSFSKYIKKHEDENRELRLRDPDAPVMNYADCILLVACGKGETLPTNPDLPADLFCCCLTTPIEISLRYFVLQNPLPSAVSIEDVMKLPGRLQERRTPMGELNWIFTAITDTIAWNTLPRALFKKLFRQDLMVAALFRNFLLAQRIMRSYQCHPQSIPALPETHHHPLWQSWDLAVEMVLSQLPRLVEASQGGKPYEYQHSTFFAEQLTAFEVYLNQGAVTKKAPDQLPIVLQVLLSQVHRLRALILLSKFLDLGPWAVNLALSIGIFPYVLKLLQSPAPELKPVMVFIWARILAVDQSCQLDLLKDNGYSYFVAILTPANGIPINNESEHRAMCAFIITMFCKSFHQGQVVCNPPSQPLVMSACLEHVTDMENPLLRQWACLCINQLWIDYPDAKWVGIREQAPQRLAELASDPVPEVRCAMIYALTSFLGIPELTQQVSLIEEWICTSLLEMCRDGSNMVRKELLVFFSTFVKRYESKFIVACFEHYILEADELGKTTPHDVRPVAAQLDVSHVSTDQKPTMSGGTIYGAVWLRLMAMSQDPHSEIARDATFVVDDIRAAVLKTPLAQQARQAFTAVDSFGMTAPSYRSQISTPSREPVVAESRIENPKNDGIISAGIRRTASVAASLKNMAFGGTSSQPSSPVMSNTDLPTRSHYPGRPVHADSSTILGPGSRHPAGWNLPPDQNDPHPNSHAYQPAVEPPTRKLKLLQSKKPVHMPLQSHFLEWSIEYFREPQMRPGEADEPGSSDYNQRLWRRERNEAIIHETQPLKDHAASHAWDIPAGMLHNGSQPQHLAFHQFENHLVVSDDRDIVSVWDWERQSRLARFSNGNAANARITDVKFINEDDQGLLMVGTADGVCKIYRNYESERDIELVTAWRALTELTPSNINSGLVSEWQQGSGRLLVGGDFKTIKVWSAAKELCIEEIPARSGSCVTSITADQVTCDIFVAGFGDGAVRVYDRRLPSREAMVKVWKDHKAWIVNVHLQRGGLRELVSGSRHGDIKLWDIRLDKPHLSLKGTTGTLRSLSVHEHAPVLAVGTDHHNVKVFNTDSTQFLSSFVPHATAAGGFLNRNARAPITATAFHPHRMMLACSTLGDFDVGLFRAGTRKVVTDVD